MAAAMMATFAGIEANDPFTSHAMLCSFAFEFQHRKMLMQAAGGEAVAAAMMATLPGIDANDPSKTLACFRFYCMVLSSIGMLQVRLPSAKVA